jgi:hypothetical protein
MFDVPENQLPGICESHGEIPAAYPEAAWLDLTWHPLIFGLIVPIRDLLR